MSKILDLIGLALIGGTIVSFIPGLIPNMEDKIEWWKGLGEELQDDIEITLE